MFHLFALRATALAALVASLILADATPPAAPRPSPMRAEPPASPAAPAGLLGLHVSGNQLVDSAGRKLRLLGVNRSGTEYACEQGWGMFDGPDDAASVRAIASWHVNAVRVPLNEDCWLAINGMDPAYSGRNYQAAIESYVSLLNSQGLYAILDLHLTAPGTMKAGDQAIMPDADHTPAFWRGVAGAFRGNLSVIFDLFNEPYAEESPGFSSDQAWQCWRDGCTISDPDTSYGTYQAAGMNSLIAAVRSAGAQNVVMVGGLQWSNDLSRWLDYEPSDPARNLVASWHSYPDNSCNTQSCWDSVIATVDAKVPVVTGETGDHVSTAATYDPVLLPWLDGHGISYLGWTWDTWDQPSYVLITGYDGTPTANYGVYFRDHLASLARGG